MQAVLNFKTTYLLFFLFSAFGCLISENAPRPVARFLFNHGSHEDEISHKRPRLVGVSYTDDRFGNSNSALFLHGNEDSYLNLGDYAALKPKSGTISLWIYIETPIHAGIGVKINPILMTRNNNGLDYCESYAISYSPEANNVGAYFSQDSLKQVTISAVKKYNHRVWHHLVIAYDFSYASFYLDGELQKKFRKNFETEFSATDSVMVGVYNTVKNRRVFRGMVDDIVFYDHVLNDKEIQALYHAPDPNKSRILFYRILLALGIAACIACIYLFIRYRFNLTLKKEKQRLEQANTLLENELRINRALMNPHFMFNSLNTLHHYILTHNVDMASSYLVKFSKLIRKILDSNMYDTISLEQEINLIDSYLEIESLRFKEHIHYKVIKDPGVVPSAITIPIMMLQPFVENSVWHGLRDKAGEKTVTVSFSLKDEGYIHCVIEDNGIGRQEKKQTGVTKKSLATNFVLQRLALLNKIYNLDCRLHILDKENGQGTIVSITLPILNKIKSYAFTGGNY